jgi:hypothetical protein
MLDEEHQDLPQDSTDTNSYSFGRIGEHNVVVACLPAGQLGTSSAAAVASRMRSRLPSIRIGLMVGIDGGVPSAEAIGSAANRCCHVSMKHPFIMSCFRRPSSIGAAKNISSNFSECVVRRFCSSLPFPTKLLCQSLRISTNLLAPLKQ